MSRVQSRTASKHHSMQHAVVRGRLAYVQLQQTFRHVRAYTGSHMYPPDPVSNPAQPIVSVEKLTRREVMPGVRPTMRPGRLADSVLYSQCRSS